MRVTILRAFPYAAHGHKSRLLAADTEEDIRDELVPGLEEAGFIDTGGRKPGVDLDDHPMFAQLRQAEEIILERDKRIEELNGEIADLRADHDKALTAAAEEAKQREAALNTRIAELEQTLQAKSEPAKTETSPTAGAKAADADTGKKAAKPKA